MTAHGSGLHWARGTAALLGVALLGLAACGDPAPLEGALPEGQRAQLDAAWVARINATDPADLPVDERNARVTALYKACEGLDRTSPLLKSVSDACQPVAVAAKLGAVLPERCAKPAAVCVRALDRIADTTEQLGAASASLATAAKQIDDPECQEQLTASTLQIQAYGDLAAAYRVLALGIEQGDEDIAALGQRRIDDANAVLNQAGTPAERTAAFREACGLEA